MNIGKAHAIFTQISDGKYTDEEKMAAVYRFLKQPTHVGISRDALIAVIRWLSVRLLRVEAERDMFKEAADLRRMRE